MEGQHPEAETRNVFDAPKDETEELPQPEPPVNASRYRLWDKTSVVVCDDCGCLVFDTGRHDNFHLMVEQS